MYTFSTPIWLEIIRSAKSMHRLTFRGQWFEIIPNGVFRSTIFLVLGAGLLNASLPLDFGVLLVDGDPNDFPSNNLWVNGIGISMNS